MDVVELSLEMFFSAADVKCLFSGESKFLSSVKMFRNFMVNCWCKCEVYLLKWIQFCDQSWFDVTQVRPTLRLVKGQYYISPVLAATTRLAVD